MTTLVREGQSSSVVFDMLCWELIKSTCSKECELIYFSPWVKNYSITSTWPSFSSNYIEIKNIQKISDLLIKLLKNSIKVTLVTKSEKTLRSEDFGDRNIRESIEFHKKLTDAGATICFHPVNHGKFWITSENTFVTSANATTMGFSGLQGNLGTFASKIDDDRYWNDTLEYSLDLISKCENPDEYFSCEHYFSK
mgnify:CR=1 FL=1